VEGKNRKAKDEVGEHACLDCCKCDTERACMYGDIIHNQKWKCIEANKVKRSNNATLHVLIYNWKEGPTGC
jgi:hypothetical protein